MNWHLGRSSGIGFFAGLCSTLLAALAFQFAFGLRGVDPRDARHVPGWIVGIGMIVGPLAGMLMHGIYRSIDRWSARKPSSPAGSDLE
jgi:hypothetical protein